MPRRFLHPVTRLRIAATLLGALYVCLLGAASAQNEWRPTGEGHGEYRLTLDRAANELVAEVRSIAIAEPGGADYLIVALHPPASSALPRPELTRVEFEDRLEKTRLNLDLGGGSQPDPKQRAWVTETSRALRAKAAGFLGDHYVAGIEWRNPGQNTAVELRGLTFRVPLGAAPGDPAPERSYRPQQRKWLERLVHNPEHLEEFRAAAPPALDPTATRWHFHERREASWRVFDVTEEGLLGLRRRDLEAAGLGGAEADLERVRIFREGIEVPTLLLQGTLIFYGVPSSSPYSRAARYWLEPDVEEDVEPLRMAPHAEPATAGTPSRFHTSEQTYRIDREEEVVMRRDRFLSILDFRWVERLLPEGEWTSTTFSLPQYSPLQEGSRLRVGFYATETETNQAGTIRIRLNGRDFSGLSLTIKQDGKGEWEVPGDLLRPTDNTLEIHPEFRTRGNFRFWLDYIEVEYRRDHFADATPFRFEIGEQATTPNREFAVRGVADLAGDLLALDLSQPLNPRRVPLEIDADEGLVLVRPEPRASGTLLLASRFDAQAPGEIVAPRVDPLTSTEAGPALDALIVYHRRFQGPAERLAEFHRSAGRPVAPIDVEAIYTEFSYGQLSPEGIRRFLAHAATKWPTPPAGVVLVGDATQDYRNEFRNDVRNLIPSWREVPREEGPGFATDHHYACVMGKDLLADLAVGRLSVTLPEDAEAIVDKYIAYAAQPTLGPWRGRLAFVADTGDFSLETEDLRVAHTPPEYAAQRVYLGSYPWINNFLFKKEEFEATRSKISPAATTAVRELFDSGQFYLTYYGHGSPNIWSDERMWFGGGSPNSDNALLNNFPRLPFIANMTCNTGAIDYPLEPWNICITEDMLRQRNGGALAVFAPGGLGTVTLHSRMSKSLRRALFDRSARTVGDVVTLAKQRFFLQGHPDQMLLMYILQGDVLAELQRPGRKVAVRVEEGSRFLPLGLEKPEVAVERIEPLDGGRYELRVRRPDGEVLHRETGLLAESARLEGASWKWRLPMRLEEPGAYRLHFYAWDEAAGLDAIGGTNFSVGRPRLAIVSVRSSPDDPGTLEVTLENTGDLPAVAVPVWIEEGNPSRPEDGWRETGTFLVELAPGERRLVRAAIVASNPISVWRVRLPERTAGVRPSIKANDARDLFALTIQPGAPAGVYLIPQMNALIGIPSVTNPRLLAEFWAVAIGESEPDQDWPRGEIRALSPAGAELGRAEIVPTQFGYPVRLAATLDAKNGPFQLEASPEEWVRETAILAEARWLRSESDRGSDSSPVESRTSVSWRLAEMADLAIESVRIPTPEPTEGETVFVEALVRNKGARTAERVRLALHALADDGPRVEYREGADLRVQDGPLRFEHLGSRLEYLIGPREITDEIDLLAPGESALLRTRWDPFEPEGDYGGAVFASQAGNEREPNMSDNLSPFAVHFRRQFELAFAGAPSVTVEPVDPRRRIVRLSATVVNRGETPAHRVDVRFFESAEAQQEDTEPIHTEAIDVLEPGERRTVTYDWQVSLEQARSGVRPTVQAAIKGSRQLVTGASTE